MSEYIDKDAAVDEGYLQDWYISSVVGDVEPVWTEAHIEELAKDFIVIPKDTPAADVAPVVHGRWYYNENGRDFGLGAWACSCCDTCNHNIPGNPNINPYIWSGSKFCPNCGAKMEDLYE